VAKGDAICQQVENRINDFSASLQTTRGDLRKLADFLSAQAQQLEDDLRALNPPVADRATVDSMLDDFHASVPILKEFADALSKGNPLEQIDLDNLPADLKPISDRLDSVGATSDQSLDRYGLNSCGSGFGD